jgi:multiple antibiotic resistance protein
VLGHWLTTVLATIAGLLPIANPWSTAVVFLALTASYTEDQRRREATLACVYALGVLWVFLFAGALLMRFFGISIPALRIAGGLIVARVGFSMLSPAASDDAADAPRPRTEIAFTPLAVPMLSGPGSIAVTIGMAAGAHSIWDHVAVATGIVIVIVISWATLLAARAIDRLLGEQGLDALTRIMGFLLVCIGVQFIGIGVIEAASDVRVMTPILEAIDRVRGR